MSDWRLVLDGFDPEAEGLRESLCTLANGYIATRGAAPESAADGVHYPGTYAAGVFNRLTTDVDGRQVDNESIVNLPNWLPLSVEGPGGRFDDRNAAVVSHHVELDPRRALLTRRTTFEDPGGRRLSLAQRRFVSLRDPHLAALETTIVAEGWDGPVVVRSAIDGGVRNSGVARYGGLDGVHLRVVEARGVSDEVIELVAETTQSRIRVAVAARTRLSRGEVPLDLTPITVVGECEVAQEFHLEVVAGEPVTIEKVVALFHSGDAAMSEPAEQACEWASTIAGDFEELCARHQVAWQQVWGVGDLTLGVDHDISQKVHLHLFHLLQTLSNNTVGLDVGVPARGLHGEAYRGHIFWDELFVFPFLSTRFPQLTRSLLLYRYRRLDAARRAAAEAGFAGAMFPWQSGSSGREETQQLHLNPESGRWLPDASHLQRHVNAAVALNVWQYFQATDDLEFLRFHGAEMLLEIARFWASVAVYNRLLDRYEIVGVVGPDEYHDGYPDRSWPGVDNNAYTNVMAVWCLCRGLDVLTTLPPELVRDLRERLSLSDAETQHWDDVSRKMKVCFHDGVISQFESYGSLEELDWEDYRRRYPDMSRLDRILEAEGDTPNRYKLAKQADVTMLFFVLSADELASILRRLGYEYDPDLIPRTIAYYDQRTSHGSTLSRVVDAWVHARLDRERSWKIFLDVLDLDLHDKPMGTTREGIHLGAMVGSLDLLQRGYAGVETRDEVLRLHPFIPAELRSLAFQIRYRRHLVDIEVTTTQASVRVGPSDEAPLAVEIEGTQHTLEPGHVLEVRLEP
jgi:trehalose/maltose hydrolase-like predicted phosphorylase